MPRVGFYGNAEKGRCPEDVCFPSCLRACLEYLGEGLGCKHSQAQFGVGRLNCAYAYLMGTSGAAFRLSWRPGWHLDNVALYLMSEDPTAPFRRAFDSIGFGCEIIQRQEGRDNPAYFRSRMVESLRDQGRPVIAQGVIGPSEHCIIAGFDDHGEVLIGWNFFQDSPEFKASLDFEPSGYFRKRDWFPDTMSLILIGEKGERRPWNEIYREALRWALQVARTPLTYGECHNGLAAYTAWAEALLRDEDFATQDLATLRERFMVHDDAVATVAEGRWYGSLFMAQVAEEVPALAEAAYAAASCYAAEHDLMWEIWGLGGFNRDDVNAKKLADPSIRRQIVPVILKAREKDFQAAEHIERALAK